MVFDYSGEESRKGGAQPGNFISGEVYNLVHFGARPKSSRDIGPAGKTIPERRRKSKHYLSPYLRLSLTAHKHREESSRENHVRRNIRSFSQERNCRYKGKKCNEKSLAQ